MTREERLFEAGEVRGADQHLFTALTVLRGLVTELEAEVPTGEQPAHLSLVFVREARDFLKLWSMGRECLGVSSEAEAFLWGQIQNAYRDLLKAGCLNVEEWEGRSIAHIIKMLGNSHKRLADLQIDHEALTEAFNANRGKLVDSCQLTDALRAMVAAGETKIAELEADLAVLTRNPYTAPRGFEQPKHLAELADHDLRPSLAQAWRAIESEKQAWLQERETAREALLEVDTLRARIANLEAANAELADALTANLPEVAL